MRNYLKNFIPSYTSPKGGRRGCICKGKRTYSSKCCDGSLQAQGIGRISGEPQNFLAQENGDLILQENNYNIKK
jgi:hypothetical protein